MTRVVKIRVAGVPAPKGSMRCLGRRGPGGRHLLVPDDSLALKIWERAVQDACRALPATSRVHAHTPAGVKLVFRVPRPKSVTPRARPRPSVPPDLDKLTRAVLDGLTRAGVWADDGQVVELRATKCYDDDHPPGVDLWVWPLDGQDQPELPD